MTDKKHRTEFVVQKITFQEPVCPTCNGTGRETTPLRNLRFCKDCPDCNGKGVLSNRIVEEVPLTEALHEIAIKTEAKTNKH